MTGPISRRAFLAGASAATVAAAGTGAFVMLRDRGDEPRAQSPAASPEATAPAAPTPQPAAARTGGVQHIVSPGRIDPDTFDSQLTGDSSTVEVLGRTHSRLVNWGGPSAAELSGDLAARWEQPDSETLLLHIDPAARWHERAPLNGRAVTAEDVLAHLRRALQIAAGGNAPLAQRYHEHAGVSGVDSPGAGIVRVRLSRPDPGFIAALAGEFALVQAPEAVAAFAGAWTKLDSDHVVGSGPWTFEWADGGVKFTASRQGHRRPVLDELWLSEPHEPAHRFVSGALEETLVRDRRDAALIASNFGVRDGGAYYGLDTRAVREASSLNQVFVERRFEREVVMSSFFVGSPPWDNPALIGAISTALNRFELAKRLFGGRARAAPPSPPALAPGTAGAISATRLKFVPGYAFREGDYRPAPEARQAWEAAGGTGLGTITVDFPSIFDPLYSASSVVVDMLNEALGPQFRPAVETYTTISKRVLGGYYGNGRAAFWFGWGAPLASSSPSRYLAETYAPGSPGMRVTGGAGTAGDSQDDMLRLVNAGFFGIVPWVQQYAEVYRRPPVLGPEPSPFWDQHRDVERTVLS